MSLLRRVGTADVPNLWKEKRKFEGQNMLSML